MQRYTFLFLLCGFILSHTPQAIAQTDSLRASEVSLEKMIGQMIMSGVGDFSYITDDAPILREIEEGLVGGVIYFEKNVNRNSPSKQLKRMSELLKQKSETPLFIGIDEEGGKVNRLKPKYGFPKTVSAQYLGGLDNADSTAFYANTTSALLSELGININFSPSVDVNVNPENPVIGKIGRSYSEDECKVARHAAEVIKTHRTNGVITVLKHFPGHGSSRADTHLGIADVSDYWQFKELMPYKNLLDSGLVDAVMTAHIVNRHLDDSMLPATLSPTIVNNILRKMMGFDGVVFSDDMQMHAISKEYTLEEAIKLAIEAGVDVLMFANNVANSDKHSGREVHGIILNLVRSGQIPVSRIEESYTRILELKGRL